MFLLMLFCVNFSYIFNILNIISDNSFVFRRREAAITTNVQTIWGSDVRAGCLTAATCHGL